MWNKIKYLVKVKNDNSDNSVNKYLKIKINSDDDFTFRKKLRNVYCEYTIY